MKIEDSVFVYRLSGGDRLSWHGRYHAHEAHEFEIHFFIEGAGQFQCNRTRYPISHGTLFLTGPREFHSIIPETGPDARPTPLSWYAFLFSFSPDALPEYAELAERLEYALSSRKTVLSIDANFRFQFEDLYQLARSPDRAFRDSARHLLSSFLWRWFGRSTQPDPRDGTQPDPRDGTQPDPRDGTHPASRAPDPRAQLSSGHAEKAHVEKALSLMQKQVRENLRVEDIAWKLGLSTEHFIRIFRNQVRMTPGQYFTRLKVEGASGLLMSSDKSVGEISDWFGFENQFHFSRIFRKCTGMSPLEYRKTYLQVVDFN
jgi:AraC-like DNA-binding protein